MVFCNTNKGVYYNAYIVVTILILVDGFLQCDVMGELEEAQKRHNPYFSRWFSAIICM